LLRGFSDFHIENHEQAGEKDFVATHKTIHAVHTGEIMGRQPTGKRVAFNVMEFIPLRDGKYIEHWGMNNIMQVMQQL